MQVTTSLALANGRPPARPAGDERGLLRRVVDYGRARPTTTGDFPEPRNAREAEEQKQQQRGSAAIMGALQGFISGRMMLGGNLGGVLGATSGVLGGYLGVRAGQQADSTLVGFGVGAGSGAVINTLLPAALVGLSVSPTIGQLTLAAAGVGALSGAVGSGVGYLQADGASWKMGAATGAATGALASAGLAALAGAPLHLALPGAVLGGVVGALSSKLGQAQAAGRQISGKGGLAGALVKGAAAGAAGAAAAAPGIASMVLLPGSWQRAAVPALLGGFSGAVGTLSGSRRAAMRDSVYGGLITGAIASAYTGNPAMAIAGAAGAGLAGRAVTPVGRAVLGVLTGAATGAVAGLPGGTAGMLYGAVAGSATAVVGTLAGPVARQVQRNGTEDLIVAVNRRLDPWLEKHPLGTKGKLAAGAAAGALTIGPIGLLFGWEGVGLLTGVGATAGAVSTYRFLKNRERGKAIDQILAVYGGKSYLLKADGTAARV